MILIASQQPIDVKGILLHDKSGGGDDRILAVGDGSAFTAGAPVLTDDFAPVDQLYRLAHSSTR